MKRNGIILLIVLVAIIVGYFFLTSERQADVTVLKYQPVDHFDPNRDAQKDLEQAVAEAQNSGRHILLDVGGDWCVWCKKLDAFFEENDDVSTFMHDNYVVLKINYSKENKNESFLAQFPKISGYPHLFVLDSSGKLLHSQNTGDLESGDHHDREKVFAFLQQWAP